MILDLIAGMNEPAGDGGFGIVGVTSGSTTETGGNVIPTIPAGYQVGDICLVFLSTSVNAAYSANWSTNTPGWSSVLKTTNMSNLAVWHRSIPSTSLPNPSFNSDMASTRRSWVSVLVRGADTYYLNIALSDVTSIAANAQLPDVWTSNTVNCPAVENLILRGFACGSTSRGYSEPVGDTLVGRVNVSASTYSLLVSSEVVPAGTGASKIPVMTPVTGLGNTAFSISIPKA